MSKPSGVAGLKDFDILDLASVYQKIIRLKIMNSKECCHSLEFTFILCKAREVQISEFLTACLLFFLLLNVFMFRENLFIPCVYLMRSTQSFSVKLLTCESHPHQTYVLNTDAIDPWFWVSGQNWEWKGFLFPFMFTNQSVNVFFTFWNHCLSCCCLFWSSLSALSFSLI